jgi:hypothetical protein
MMVGAGEGNTVIGSSKKFTMKLDYSQLGLATADTPQALEAMLRKRDADAFNRKEFR